MNVIVLDLWIYIWLIIPKGCETCKLNSHTINQNINPSKIHCIWIKSCGHEKPLTDWILITIITRREYHMSGNRFDSTPNNGCAQTKTNKTSMHFVGEGVSLASSLVLFWLFYTKIGISNFVSCKEICHC